MSEIKSVKMFLSNKPWVSKQLNSCLNERRIAFCNGNMELLCEKRRQLREEIFKAKIDFKNKGTADIRQAWDGLNILMGRSSKKSNIS